MRNSDFSWDDGNDIKISFTLKCFTAAVGRHVNTSGAVVPDQDAHVTVALDVGLLSSIGYLLFMIRFHLTVASICALNK